MHVVGSVVRSRPAPPPGFRNRCFLRLYLLATAIDRCNLLKYWDRIPSIWSRDMDWRVVMYTYRRNRMKISKKGKVAAMGTLFILLATCWCNRIGSAVPNISSEPITAFELSPEGKRIAFIDKQGLKIAPIAGDKSRLLVKIQFLPE